MYSSFSLSAALQSRIISREAAVVTVGLGYVGLPLALTAHEAGFSVTGFDLDAGRVERINAGERVISYFPPDRISKAVASGRFRASADPAVLGEADIILICVPTPLDHERQPDLSYVIRAGKSIAGRLRPGQLVILESTVWPGATGGVLRPLLEAGGLRAGHDLFLAFSPEREDPGNASFSTRTIPKVVGADDTASRQLADSFYQQIVECTVPVGSTATAEAVKLVENTFRNVNIGLANELKAALGAMGIDVWSVIEAAATKPFGFMPFYPGPGIGGACIPVSPAYLAWRARDVGQPMQIVELARRINEDEPARLAAAIGSVVAGRGTALGTAPGTARILLLGIAYKKDVEDSRESPALELMARLEGAGARVDYHDRLFPVLPPTRDHPDLAGRESVALDPGAVAGYDAVVVTTDHSGVDYRAVAEAAKLVIDTRNVYSKLGLHAYREKLLKL